jgi:hypothetical protein
LADTAIEIAADMDYYGGLAEWSQHSRELANAAGLLRQWASEIDAHPRSPDAAQRNPGNPATP